MRVGVGAASYSTSAGPCNSRRDGAQVLIEGSEQLIELRLVLLLSSLLVPVLESVDGIIQVYFNYFVVLLRHLILLLLQSLQPLEQRSFCLLLFEGLAVLVLLHYLSQHLLVVHCNLSKLLQVALVDRLRVHRVRQGQDILELVQLHRGVQVFLESGQQ